MNLLVGKLHATNQYILMVRESCCQNIMTERGDSRIHLSCVDGGLVQFVFIQPAG